MKLQFDSVEEVLEFALRVRPMAAAAAKDPDEIARLLGCVAFHRSKVAAIKAFRAYTAILEGEPRNLRDAKEAIDRFWGDNLS